MRNALAVAAACVLAGVTAASAAQFNRHGDREQFMTNYCGRHNDSDCRDWNRNRDRWDDARYHRWYERHRYDPDFHEFGPADAAAAIFGFAAGAAAGAITGSINGAAEGSHETACAARYRSYDPASDTFMGNDGYRHECRL